MSPDLALRLLPIIEQLGIKSIIVIGGEPTIWKHLLEFNRQCRQAGIQTTLVTNAYRFSNDEFWAEYMENPNDKVSPSIKAFDEESAKASGIRTDRINKILVLLTALTVVLAMKLVGIMLISALLILPPVTALQIARGFKATIVISSLAGISSVIIGIFVSFLANLPTGATIVIINFILFLASFTYRHWRQR